MMADDNAQDRVGRVGKHVSTIVIALLGALFIYGYLGPLIFRYRVTRRGPCGQ